MMRTLRLTLYLVVGLLLGGVSVLAMAQTPVPYATAGGIIPTTVVGPFSSYDAAAAAMRGGASTATSTGVKLAASGVANATLSTGAKVAVTVAVDGVVQRSAIAAATAAFVKWGRITNPALMAGSVVYAVYQESGYQTCPPPDFFCKPGSTTAPTYPSGWSTYNTSTPYAATAELMCDLKASGYPSNYFPTKVTYYPGEPTRASCSLKGGAVIGDVQVRNLPQTAGCTAPSTLVNGQCVSVAGAYSDAELQQAITDKMAADPAFHKKYWDAVSSDMARNYPTTTGMPGIESLIPAGTPLTVTSPGITTAGVEILRRTLQNPDGSTSTEYTTAATTITPKAEPGATVGKPGISYPTATTYTTTTTNNTTNVSTTNTATTNTTTPEQTDFCKSNPDSLACAKLGTPVNEEMPKSSKNLQYTPDTVEWGASAGCPSSVPIDLGRFGGGKSLDYTPFCDTATRMRPFILAGAAASAMFMLFLAFKVG